MTSKRPNLNKFLYNEDSPNKCRNMLLLVIIFLGYTFKVHVKTMLLL